MIEFNPNDRVEYKPGFSMVPNGIHDYDFMVTDYKRYRDPKTKKWDDSKVKVVTRPIVGNERYLYNYFCRLGNNSGEIFPSLETIMTKLGCTKPTVIHHLDILIHNGFISKKTRKKGKVNESNIYCINTELKELFEQLQEISENHKDKLISKAKRDKLLKKKALGKRPKKTGGSMSDIPQKVVCQTYQGSMSDIPGVVCQTYQGSMSDIPYKKLFINNSIKNNYLKTTTRATFQKVVVVEDKKDNNFPMEEFKISMEQLKKEIEIKSGLEINFQHLTRATEKVVKVYGEFNKEALILAFKAAANYRQHNKINNLTAFIIKAIENRYELDQVNKASNAGSFGNFEQRNYNFSELEAQLLGNKPHNSKAYRG